MYLLSSVREVDSMSKRAIIADLKRAGVWIADYSKASIYELQSLWLSQYGTTELASRTDA